MGKDSWQEARLIPTSGINGNDERERRATSALLAVMAAVREFGRVVTAPLGAPVGAVETFIEVPFMLRGQKYFPDGLIRITRGQRTWTALVEVKTGGSLLETAQLESYLDVAKEQGFDAVVTISNEIPAIAGRHPAVVDRQKIRSVSLHHWSWSQLLAEAVVAKEHRGVADPDQAWILGELIRYLEHPRSGALQFNDMGPAWVQVRDAVTAGTLRPSDQGVGDVVTRFDALLRYAGLALGRQLGTDVVPLLSRRELAEPQLRTDALIRSLTTDGVLAGAIRIPNAVGAIVVTADLRAGKVSCQVDVDAPRDGRATTRVKWLVRQLAGAPESTRIEASAARARGANSAELLKVVREDPAVLVLDPTKDVRAFRVALDQPLGTKRGIGRGSFIDSVLVAIDSFYADVVQGMKAWTASPPRMREEPEIEQVAAPLIATALSSQDGPELVTPELVTPELVTPELVSPELVTPELVTPDVIDLKLPRHPTRRELRLTRSLEPGQEQTGWYRDPENDRQLRWWDGQAWSMHIYAGQPALA